LKLKKKIKFRIGGRARAGREMVNRNRRRKREKKRRDRLGDNSHPGLYLNGLASARRAESARRGWLGGWSGEAAAEEKKTS